MTQDVDTNEREQACFGMDGKEKACCVEQGGDANAKKKGEMQTRNWGRVLFSIKEMGVRTVKRHV